jgi:hypothetical protein
VLRRVIHLPSPQTLRRVTLTAAQVAGRTLAEHGVAWLVLTLACLSVAIANGFPL